MNTLKKIIWSLIILLASIWNIHIIYKKNAPYIWPDLDKSTVVCDNGKSFAMNKYGSSSYLLEFDYECSSVYDEISFEQFIINFGENYKMTESYSTIKCMHNNLTFKADRPENTSIFYYRYKCSEYRDTMSYEEYETNLSNYERNIQMKEIGGHTKQYIYTALSIIILSLFWYLVTFKKIKKMPIYLQIFVTIGNIIIIVFIIYTAYMIIGGILNAVSGDL